MQTDRVLNLFATKLENAGDKVGATLSRAGFLIKKNKNRDTILAETAKETDSVKLLIAAKVFNKEI
jgi:hypothetical protein